MMNPQLAEMFRRQQMQGQMSPGMQMPQMQGQMQGPMQQFAPQGGIGLRPQESIQWTTRCHVEL